MSLVQRVPNRNKGVTEARMFIESRENVRQRDSCFPNKKVRILRTEYALLDDFLKAADWTNCLVAMTPVILVWEPPDSNEIADSKERVQGPRGVKEAF
jgi:hypothetical protein